MDPAPPSSEPAAGLSLTAAEALMSDGLPSVFLARQQRHAQAPPLSVSAISWGPLGPTHIAATESHISSGATLGVKATPRQNLRSRHHRIAQCLAAGLTDGDTAVFVGCAPITIAYLKQDPAFQELITYYDGERNELWADFVTAAKTLSLDAVDLLSQRIDEAPESFPNTVLLELVKVMADRSGNAPLNKSMNLNVNMGVGDRLKAARERTLALTRGEGDPE